MHSVEFADIRIRAALPLHPYLSKHPHLFLRLVSDGTVCGDTAGVDGDLTRGVWAFNARLYAPGVRQSLNVSVLTGVKGPGTPVVSVMLKVAQLLERAKARRNGYQDFDIFESGVPIQLKLVMTCSIKVSSISGRVSALGNKDHTISKRRNNEYEFDAEKMQLLSREELESLYPKIIYTPDQNQKAHALSGLAHTYHLLYNKQCEKADLEKAISIHEEAMQFTRPSHSHLALHLVNFAMALSDRFQQSGNHIDIERAISYCHTALRFTRDLDALKPYQFLTLGGALQQRFDRFGSLLDLENSIFYQRETIRLMPDGDPEKSHCLNSLGVTLKSRFERLGDPTDLEDAISNYRQAVQLTPDGHLDKPSQLNNLGSALHSRFGRLGVLTDLEGAISLHRRAVKLTPDGDPNKPTRLNNVASALRSRFGRLDVLVDLEGAILLNRQAVEITPDGHPNKPSFLENVGSALQSRFERLGVLTDLEDAISNLQRAVQLTPDDHPEKPSQLMNLGLALQSRFDRLSDLADLEGAISNLQEAVELTPDSHPDKPSRLNNFGSALRSRFEDLGFLKDLEGAILNLQQAVRLAQDAHPDQHNVYQLYNLGLAFGNRFWRLGILSDLENSLSALSTAANSGNGSAMHRFKAARRWAKVSEEHSRSPLDAFRCAIRLLPQIAWLGLAVTAQHALLADVGSIVRDAVAAAIRFEEYETAVEWAEQGRSVVWQNLLGLRSPIDDLHETHPELADRLRSIAKQLESPESHLKVPTASAGDVSLEYSKLAVEWDNIVEEVRRIPKFEGFLKPKGFRQLAPAAHEGPVVILNVNDAQCDALILILDKSVPRKVSTVHIPLDRFSHEKSKKLFQTLTELLSSAGVRERSARKTGRVQSQADGEAKFKVILGILWRDVVKPVIEGLAFQIKPKRPPRIWWCATGLLAFLPIHAAGLYDTQEVGEKVSDYVISSYAPTLSAILEVSDPIVRENFQVMTVAQASAPGAPLIPKTEDEARIIQRLAISTRVLNLTGKNATVKRVQEGMMESNWVHLACHGQQNPHDPMESGFLLHDKILKLSEIIKMTLPKTDFAFLSACQTAMGDEKLAEESVHLAAGMFLSGCRGVIATTWSIRDDDAPKIAREVYSRMFKDGKPNRKEAAYALHEAVKRLRASGAKFTSWVPFIHIGR